MNIITGLLGAAGKVLRKITLLCIRSLKIPSLFYGMFGFVPKKTFLGIVNILQRIGNGVRGAIGWVLDNGTGLIAKVFWVVHTVLGKVLGLFPFNRIRRLLSPVTRLTGNVIYKLCQLSTKLLKFPVDVVSYGVSSGVSLLERVWGVLGSTRRGIKCAVKKTYGGVSGVVGGAWSFWKW